MIGANSEQLGVVPIGRALDLARETDMDLVEVAPTAKPPVCRIMDYGKFKYEQSVRDRENRKKQTRTVIKEVQFRPKIGASDFEVKRRRVVRFLQDNDKVKVTMRFRGREVTHPEIGTEILSRLRDSVSDYGEVETAPRLEGRQMTMVLAPVRNVDRVSDDVRTRDEGSADDGAAAELETEEETAASEETDAGREPIEDDTNVAGDEDAVEEGASADDADE